MEKTEGEENIGRGKSSFFGHPKFEKVTRFVIDHLCFPINLILFVLKLYLQKECLAMYNESTGKTINTRESRRKIIL
jgi:hypothetical protein